ncbi:peptidoglycan editing factor PgeF [Clostridium boliviensis]|uniref:Purine nucleoside phosphorylase n=1 Tax=Clostridium boliviensis TaxID=318465 RepID=A0ABU4GPM7_9CLOT|nr:peptidoglycan editing factor PgeF [Clostridium boliviensis]MDW2799581.1 peptidoglycan editing factor PgeF [Clostridium boliviensis]
MSVIWNRKNKEQGMDYIETAPVPYLSFPLLEKTGLVAQGFSTKLGGVSQGKFATLNFTFTRGDNPDHVLENYKRMAAVLGVEKKRMVLSYQTHTTNVRLVTEDDAGKGIVKERDFKDIDGLITNVPGITLVTFYADCVPLYFLDPVHKAIGLSHSGWRGTVKRMGAVTVQKMKEAYNTKAEDLIACIGPSICKDCYEVGEEVALEFKKAFAWKDWNKILQEKDNGKFQLDLWKANEIILADAGIRPENIQTTDICTHCNSDYLFSHRTCGNERGNLAAFLGLKE